jgi:S-DNA-T family DNA segregation ATPase FtsK/SpoIIIE
MGSINFLVGPWLLVVAIIYSALYIFQLRLREKGFDYILPFVLLALIFSFVDYFLPQVVGPGLHHYLNTGLKIAPYLPLIITISAFTFVMLWAPGFSKAKIAYFFKKLQNKLKTSSPISNVLQKRLAFLTTNAEDIGEKGVSDVSTQLMEEVSLPVDSSNQHGDLLETTEVLEILPAKNEIAKIVEPNKIKTNVQASKAIQKIARSGGTDYFKLVEKKMRAGSVNRNVPEKNYFDSIITRIEDKLAEFRINGTIINILKGPVVDTFELELGNGVKVSKITSITEDMSLALFGAPIRIVYPMKGKNTVGIEVPRNPRELIFLGEILESDAWKQNNFALPLAMGKDAFGVPFVVDLASMPHMLVAGATGAGKSVFINSLLMSLLVKRSPEQMRLILIDPKQLELALYAKLPHLVLPVLTDSKMASVALLYAVQEMERRYSILRELAVRNIDGFNRKIKDADPSVIELIRKHYPAGTTSFSLPYLVVIVDEFADLILTKSGKDIENNICRLAAKARASGIHLVLATQRPSVDVITGLIKSNFPTRVSFRVTTSIDSRTILNAQGAELLLGKGDMLYKHGPEMTRVHSSFVEEDEIEAFTADLCTYEHDFDSSAMEFLENQNAPGAAGGGTYDGEGAFTGEAEDDDLYEQAVHIVAECRTASASMLQRRLKVGYNRAANLIEIMELRGVVGPAQGSKARKVLVSPPSSQIP